MYKRHVDASVNLKSQDQEYEEAMKNGGSTVGPIEFYPAYEKELLDKQDAEKIDAVATATTSGDNLKSLMTALKKNMQKGDTSEVIVNLSLIHI